MPTLAACGMCQLVSCCQNTSEPLEPLNSNFMWPLQNLHYALDSTSHSGPLRPTEITNHQAIMSTNEQEQQGSDSPLEPKDSFETSRVNAKFGSTALNPLPCCARRRWLRGLNHAGWQSSLKAHGRCPWLPGKTQGPWDDQERDGACKATQNCWIALGQQLTIKSRDVHVRE